MTGGDKPVPERDEQAALLWKCYRHAAYGIGDGSITWWTVQPVERALFRRMAEAFAEVDIYRSTP